MRRRTCLVASMILSTIGSAPRSGAFSPQVGARRVPGRNGGGCKRSVLRKSTAMMAGSSSGSTHGSPHRTSRAAPWRKDDNCESSATSRLEVAASSPVDIEPTTAPRPLLPAEREINAGANGLNAGIVNVLKGMMMRYYGERTYARFYALETIARVPYFGYLCVLHLYETLGQWRQASYLKVHFAESYNELHHLLIMEELGGNVLFRDRWFAQHAAFFYFFIVVLLYLSNPRNAYNLNQHVEEHAYSTYDGFLADHGDELKEKAAPMIAKTYYGRDKLYVFNGLHNDPEDRSFDERDRDRPIISNLFDTFVAIRNDEWEHVKTMKALQEDVATDR